MGQTGQIIKIQIHEILSNMGNTENTGWLGGLRV